MIIAYESKTGFTKKYADMLAAKTGLKAIPARELSKVDRNEEIVFLGWIKVGKIQGLKKARNHNVKVVCGSGTARSAEPDTDTVLERNNIKGIPFFYLRGGCLPMRELKGLDKLMMSMFVKVLKARKDKDEETIEAIRNIENGFDGVKEENLGPVVEWIMSHKA